MQTHQQAKVGAGKLRTTIVSIIVVLTILFGSAITLATIAPAIAADTGGYPYTSIACVWSPYATTGTGNWCKEVNASGKIISEYDWGRFMTTTLAVASNLPTGTTIATVRTTLLGKWHPLGCLHHYAGLGNAKDWPANALGKGLTVNMTPAIGAATVNTSGLFGHVAFISAYDSSSGIITVQEYNKKQDGNYETRTGTLSNLGFSQVVHLKKYETSPYLNGIAAVSAIDVWAVGERINNFSPGGAQTLIEHWNGSSWKVISSPNPVSYGNSLYSVAAISATDVWAVGVNYNNLYIGQALIEYWDGSTWNVVPSPSP